MFKKILLTITIFYILVSKFYVAKVHAEMNEGIEITVYNQNLGLIKDKRLIEFKKGKNIIKFTDVASLIDVTSVHFKALKYKNEIMIQEQNYEYDLVSADKLLEKYIDKVIQVMTEDNQVYEGILLKFDANQLTLAKTKEETIILLSRQKIRDIKFPKLPQGLMTKPTLIWEIISEINDRDLCELTYLTKGINWQADYVAIVNDKNENLDLNGWVTIDNQSGISYKEAKLKLIAGDIHLLKPEEVRKAQRYEMAIKAAAPREFEEKTLSEYHLYTFFRPTTLNDKQTKQINLLSSNNVSCTKIFTYNETQYGKKLQVNLEFVNSEKNGLGIPLPKGKFRVYEADKEGSLEFLGEDEIDHTPKDEEVRIYLGDAFDVVGERKMIERQKITPNIREDTYEIEIRNHKNEDIEVLIVEPQYGNWKVIKTTQDYKIKDAHTLEFKIKVRKNDKGTIRYTVRCEW